MTPGRITPPRAMALALPGVVLAVLGLLLILLGPPVADYKPAEMDGAVMDSQTLP